MHLYFEKLQRATGATINLEKAQHYPLITMEPKLSTKTYLTLKSTIQCY